MKSEQKTISASKPLRELSDRDLNALTKGGGDQARAQTIEQRERMKSNRAQELREECLRERKSLLVETVFSAPDKLDFIRQAKEADFLSAFSLSEPTAQRSTPPASPAG